MKPLLVNRQLIQVVAFDCDGVLFDSSEANRAFYNHLLTHFKLPQMTAEQFAYAHMHTVDQALAYLFDDPEILVAVQQYRRQMSYLPFIHYMVLEPHLRRLLACLRPNYKTAIATNRTDTMDRVLSEHRLEGCFDYVVTALDVEHPKPHPAQLLALLKFFDIAPQQMIYVGDSPLDAQAAQAAQVPFIAYRNPDLQADLHINTLQQIEGVLYPDVA